VELALKPLYINMKYNYKHIAVALVVILTMPAIMHAQEDNNGQLPPISPSTTDSVQSDNENAPSSTKNIPAKFGEHFRKALGDKGKNIGDENRNNILENRLTRPNNEQSSSSTSTEDNNFDASSTDQRSTGSEYKMEREQRFSSTTDETASSSHKVNFADFQNRRENLAHQTEIAYNNLVQIRSRIDSRIQKEQAAGVDMTDAIAKLAIADTKITLASSSIDAMNAFVSTTTSTSVSSTTIEVSQPRKLYKDLISSVRDARASLNDVVTSIAKALGVDLNNDNASSSPETASSTTK